MKSMMIILVVLGLNQQSTSSITCGPEIVAEVTPYTAENPESPLRLRNLPGRLLSNEEGEAVCAPGPCRQATPYSMSEFKSRVAQAAKMFDTNQIRYETHTKGEVVATTAIISNARSGDRRVEQFMTHLSRNGIACGTYDSHKKK
jgi:hypothetical protein